MIQSMRGFKDILPHEMHLWKTVIEIASSLFSDFGYGELCTPLIEKTDLFIRSIGERTDIVEKEMYTFSDRKGALVTLRPEATASIVRALIQHKMYSVNYATKLYTFGPMFRRERPQKGRYRQFYQLDVEAFGVEFPYIDAEVIFVLYTLLNRLLVKNLKLHLNSLGCPDCRPLFEKHLVKLITKAGGKLCPDCLNRKNKNPLRILDCKVQSCREITFEIKPISNFLCYDCEKHINEVMALISSLGVPFKLDKHLVRGLDYYTRTIFEIHHEKLGSQSAVAGGGRYNNLVKNLGGPDIPAVGFAVGLDRLLKIVKLDSGLNLQIPALFLVVLGEKAMKIAFEWQMKLNNISVKSILGNFNKSLKSQMKQANRFNVSYVLIIGEQELLKREVIFRCMETGSQMSIPISDNNVITTIKSKIGQFSTKKEGVICC